MKKVIVTGTRGFIGVSLMKELDKLGYLTHGFDDSYLSENNWTEKLLQILETLNYDAVFHVGACSDTLEQNVEYMMTRNYESTKIIMDWCIKNNKPMIYSSSAANYGTNNLYPSNLYKGEKITLFPKKPQRDFVYIKDIVSANIHALKNYEELSGKYYEVGSGTARTFEDVLNNMGIEYDYTSEDVIPNGYQFYTCSDKNKWMSGWESTWSLESGIKDYCEYLKK